MDDYHDSVIAARATGARKPERLCWYFSCRGRTQGPRNRGDETLPLAEPSDKLHKWLQAMDFTGIMETVVFPLHHGCPQPAGVVTEDLCV